MHRSWEAAPLHAKRVSLDPPRSTPRTRRARMRRHQRLFGASRLHPAPRRPRPRLALPPSRPPRHERPAREPSSPTGGAVVLAPTFFFRRSASSSPPGGDGWAGSSIPASASNPDTFTSLVSRPALRAVRAGSVTAAAPRVELTRSMIARLAGRPASFRISSARRVRSRTAWRSSAWAVRSASALPPARACSCAFRSLAPACEQRLYVRLVLPRELVDRPGGHARLGERLDLLGSFLVALLLQTSRELISSRRELVERKLEEPVDLTFERRHLARALYDALAGSCRRTHASFCSKARELT